jgi:hypothetical protein
MKNTDDIDSLRMICEQKRNDLRSANQNGEDIDKAVKNFVQAFNAYQHAKATLVGIKVKPISAFHVLRNINMILSIDNTSV